MRLGNSIGTIYGKGQNLFTTKIRQMRENWLLYVMLIPFILWYAIFVYKPIGGLQIAFKDYSLFHGVSESPWIGFDNFKTFLTGPYVGRLFKNTFLIGFYGLLFGFPVPIILALMLNEVKNRMYKQGLQTALFLPYFISSVVIAGMVINILSPSGVLNTILGYLGFEKTFFLAEPKYFRTIYTTMGIWKSSGYNSIIYLAAVSGIDQQLYEACVLDGGKKMRQIWHVTLPGVLPTIVIMFVMACGSIMSVGYETIILLYQPITYETADVISSYTYRIGLTEGNYGLSTAVGLFNSVMSVCFVAFSNFVSKRLTGTSLW